MVKYPIEADLLEHRYICLNNYFFLATMLCVLAEKDVVLINKQSIATFIGHAKFTCVLCQCSP